MAIVDQLDPSAVVTQTRTVTNKQIRLWASENGSPILYIYLIIDGVSALPSDAETVFHMGGAMIEGDALAARIKTVLGFSDAQMTAAVTAMLTYPK